MGLHDLQDAMGDQSSPRGTEHFLCKHFVLFLKKIWMSITCVEPRSNFLYSSMRRPCCCTKQWQNVAQVLDNNIIKFPKDFLSYCSVNQHGHMKTENAEVKHFSRRLVNPYRGLFDNQVLFFFFLYTRISASLKGVVNGRKYKVTLDWPYSRVISRK